MNTQEKYGRDPAAIEADISRTRASLDRKLYEIERRLSPKQRLADMRVKWSQARSRFDGAPLAAWGAAAAVAAGSLMAINGLRRSRTNHFEEEFGEEPTILISCEESLEA